MSRCLLLFMQDPSYLRQSEFADLRVASPNVIDAAMRFGMLRFSAGRPLCQEIAKMTRVTWISGWGVAPEGMRAAATSALPDAEHRFRPPTPESVSDLNDCDILAGWSLGAWRILEAAARGLKFEGRVLLMAPFVAFCSEHGLGGNCSLTQVRWLRRWLERDPEAALKDFYARAGLDAGMPYAGDHLIEGLDRLAESASPELQAFASAGLPANFSAVVGEFDPLLNAEVICQVIKGCTVVNGARHRFEDLIGPALRKEPHAL